MFTVAGQQVAVPTPQFHDWLRWNVNPSEAVRWVTRSWPGTGNVGLTWPTGFRVPRQVRVNQLVWPSCASRWAYVFVVMDADGVDAAHDAAFGADGLGFNKVPVVIDSYADDGTGPRGEYIQADMYMMPPSPLSSEAAAAAVPGGGSDAGTSDTNNLYLVTLVDERYFWWFVPFLPMTIADSTAWTDVLANVNSSISAYIPSFSSITMDAVPSAYLKASPSFVLPYEPTAPIVDALAFNVGMRFVRKFDGTSQIQTAATALSQMTADFNANPGRALRAGGDLFPNALPYP